MIRISGVGWRTKGTHIVRDVSLTVSQGQRFGLIGPNGSGKSTLLRLIAGLQTPTSGQVRLQGKTLAELGRRGIARRLAFVAQAAETADRITVRDAVGLGRTPWLSALSPWSAEDDRIVTEALAAVDMARFDRRDWMTLSGGERQRVHIARALAQRPQILLLDEPANHLDIHHQLSILRLIGDLGLTTMIALHDLNQAMECDRLGVMHKGQLIATGTPAEVMTPDLLARVFGVRIRELVDPVDGAKVLRFHEIC
ncbi:ABC transporter ATP-binding protein [Falsirhodobacter sp. alg1]|uniref:ABC transporter ATP-binding protein n=1 Tax=Falsirhodobacter sp. alg1 TaxID=1472418 RepID=UPI0005F0C50C|nr:ABC transporter ATP-binding protein [Falsirhodobacter sp. alg1]